jgi:hypothetical protein
MWVPLSMVKEVLPNYGGYKDNFSESLLIMARLKPGISSSGAISNVNLLVRQIVLGSSDAQLSQENLQKLDRTKVPLTPMATGLSALRRQFSEPLQIPGYSLAFTADALMPNTKVGWHTFRKLLASYRKHESVFRVDMQVVI